MAAGNAHIRFPLDGLIEQLQLSGFEITLGQRLQLLRVLQAYGTEALRDPDRLKGRLAPIVSRSAREQEEFYRLFDRYLSGLQDWRPEPPPPPPPRWWERLPPPLWYLLSALLFAALAFLLWPREEEEQQRLLRAEHPPQLTLGDTLRAENQSLGYDSLRTRFDWQLRDLQSGETELERPNTYHLQLPIAEAGAGPEKELLLIATDSAAGRRDTARSRLRLLCPNPPAYSRIQGPNRAPVDSLLRFRPAEAEQEDLLYAWDFGDGARDTGFSVTHAYAARGGYQVQLHISRPEAGGYCEQRLPPLAVSVGQDEKVFLAWKALQMGELPREWRLGLLFYLLPLLLLAAALYFWYRWLRQPLPPPPSSEAERQEQRLQRRFAHADRAPYAIPFRRQDDLIQLDPGLFRLARILRLRQEGLRVELDVPATVQRTIEQGGFPSVQWRRTTVPPNYLFLIDEQAPHSHQAQLYRFLLDFLQGQDVHIDAFWYRREPLRFWNSKHPEGLSLEQLYRRFPQHRLLLLGDAHELLDPHAQEAPSLRAEYARSYARWKNRLLLTPLAAVDWTYREGVLYELFPLFPGDMQGVQAAMAFLEREQEEEDEKARPGFREWRRAHRQPPLPPETNYRLWQRLDTYRDYFRGQPQLFRWCCALAVYPEPTWSLTLSIGQAIGAPVTFDHLLLLSRIPWLQNEPLPPRLRREFLRELDPETERRAREAVRRELAAVAGAVENSHANYLLQTELAMQTFLLQPEAPDNQQALRYLKDSGSLGRRQQRELQEALQRMHPEAEGGLEALLQGPKDEEEAPPQTRPLNRTFYRALGFTLAALLTALGFFLFDGSTLPSEVLPQDEASSLLWRSRTRPDSAVLYNNRGVEAFRALQQAPHRLTPDSLQPVARWFERALDVRDYPLAADNLSRTRYHLGLLHYHDYLARPEDQAAQRQAEAYFEQAATPDARHGLGLLHWYAGRNGEAERVYEELNAAGFFDTLRLRPNLQTLLYPDADSIAGSPRSDCVPAPDVDLLPGDTLCAGEPLRLSIGKTDSTVYFYRIEWGDGQVDTLTGAAEAQHPYRVTAESFELRVAAYARCEQWDTAYNERTLRIEMRSTPVADFRLPAAGICPDEELTLEPLTPAGATPRWRFGDGRRSEEATPRISYAQPGEYSIQLILRNACGADTATQVLQVLPPERCGQGAAPQELSGRITDAAGQPLAGAEVLAGDANAVTNEQLRAGQAPFIARTDAAGNFRLREIPAAAEQLQLRITAPGYRDTLLRHTLATGPLELALQAEESSPPEDVSLPEMVNITGGTFTMGCLNAERDGDCDDDEKPHEVTVDAFALSRYEVTNQQYAAFLNARGNREEGERTWYNIESSYAKIREENGRFSVESGFEQHPVTEVSWYGARAYCRWLSEQTGRNYRLPTEAEWEYAARGGKNGAKDAYLYAGSDELDEVGWYLDNADGTQPVGGKKPNQLGLYDMSGNVYEWCADWYGDYPAEAQRNPAGPAEGSYRVIRGGGWYLNARYCRVSYRINHYPTFRHYSFGFRVALS